MLSICIAYLMHTVVKLNMPTNARSVWVKVWPRQSFSGGSIGEGRAPVQLQRSIRGIAF
jgi:hypothetical protein